MSPGDRILEAGKKIIDMGDLNAGKAFAYATGRISVAVAIGTISDEKLAQIYEEAVDAVKTGTI